MADSTSAILTYHSIDDSGSMISVSPAMFRAQMESLERRKIRVAPLRQAIETPGAVALTFDDAYENFLSRALPVLEELGFPATVFVVSGYAGEKTEWPAQGPYAPCLPTMSWEQLRSLSSRGIAVGSHTRSHAPLTMLREDKLREELRSSRDDLEQRLGNPVEEMAYPYGALDSRVRKAAADYYRFACTTRLAFTTPESDRLAIPRLDVYYLHSTARFEAVTEGRGRSYIAWRRLFREVRSAVAPGAGESAGHRR
jgi:peptidoglycan/xylan/chitin deacetylase (PgdA/CDA1 family)